METFKLEFTAEQMAVLDKALQQMPYYLAAPVIATINRQIAQQREADKDAAAE